MSYALDANVLLFASDQGSPMHEAALAFLARCAEGPEPLCLPWPVLMAYLRISTHPRVFQRPLSWVRASDNVERLLTLPHVRVLSEGDGYWETLREVTKGQPIRGNLVPDAHIAGLLRQHDVRVLFTNDRDFRRFDFLEVRDPFS